MCESVCVCVCRGSILYTIVLECACVCVLECIGQCVCVCVSGSLCVSRNGVEGRGRESRDGECVS